MLAGAAAHMSRGPGSRSPRTRASLANSLQSDLRWMMILVPVLTPEASAISNTPELRHRRERASSHVTTDKSHRRAVTPPGFSQQSPLTLKGSQTPPFITQLSPETGSFLSGTVAAAGGMGPSCSPGHGLRGTTSRALCPPERAGRCARHWEQSEAWRPPLTPLLTAFLNL